MRRQMVSGAGEVGVPLPMVVVRPYIAAKSKLYRLYVYYTIWVTAQHNVHTCMNDNMYSPVSNEQGASFPIPHPTERERETRPGFIFDLGTRHSHLRIWGYKSLCVVAKV
jgi:hypothetical protein